MISDKQIEEFENRIESIIEAYAPSSIVREELRNAIEAHEQNKWIEFDKDDTSTWPEPNTPVLITDGENIGHAVQPGTGFFRIIASNTPVAHNLTHWQYPPELPKD